MDTIVANMRSFLEELDRVYKSIAEADKVRTYLVQECHRVCVGEGRGVKPCMCTTVDSTCV